jgi:hypothetical protein
MFHSDVLFVDGAETTGILGALARKKFEWLNCSSTKSAAVVISFRSASEALSVVECVFFFGSSSLRKRLVPDLVITGGS